jgi:ABC-type multidrug transport system fused ATPase/permease subunit
MIVPVFMFSTYLFRKNIRSGFQGVRSANADINSKLVETINGIREIRLFNRESISLHEFETSNKSYLHSYLKIVSSYAVFFPVMDFIIYISILILLTVVSFLKGISVTAGEFAAFFIYIGMFFRPLKQLAENFNTFQSAMAAMERIRGLLETSGLEQEQEKHVTSIKDIHGTIGFEHVSFIYPSGGNEVIADVSFSVKEGEKIAIVGHTGSGKTTLIKLLLGLYTQQKGVIRVGGHDIKDLGFNILRQKIAFVPQEVFLFSGTVKENIAMFNEAYPEEMIYNSSVFVGAHSIVAELDNGYTQRILENGSSLSAGEKQLLSFARVPVKDPDILVLDEATSNIDSENEKKIEKAIQRMMSGKTAIIIAHRLSTIQSVDRILVMHKGKLVEEGSHQQLLKAGGIYEKLYKLQTLHR